MSGEDRDLHRLAEELAERLVAEGLLSAPEAL